MIDLRIFTAQATVDALAWTLLHFLWQGALAGLAAFVLLRVARPERATTRYAIGVGTLAAMLVACVATFVMLSSGLPERDRPTAAIIGALPELKASVDETVFDTNGIRREQTTIATNSPAQVASWRPVPIGPTATFVLVLSWGIGVLALSLRLLGGWLLTRGLTRHAVSGVSPAIVAAAGVIAERLALRRAVAILESGAVAVPTLVGWVKPVVLLPAAALSGLAPEQLEAILAHELAHVRRHDYLVNLLQSAVETLLFYHPATWWVSAEVRAEREHCCDDLAVEACGDRLVYVSALAELTTITNHRAFALAATDGSLVGRVQRILGRPRSAHEPTPAWALLVLVALLAGGIGSSNTVTTAAAVVPKAASTTAPRSPSTAVTGVVAKKDTAAKPTEVRDDRTRNNATSLDASAKSSTVKVYNTPADAFFGIQWFRGWFDSTPPQPPPPPPAPAAPPAPGATEAPPAPPAPAAFAHGAPEAPEPVAAPPPPPAPPEPEAPQEIGSRGSGNMTWSDNGEQIRISWNGAFRLADDEKDIAWMEDGATLTIDDGVGFKSRQARLRGVNGRVERTFSINGARREYEPEGRAFVAAALDRMIKQSAAFAKERVAKFLKRGGPDAVFAEIDKLAPSSYTRRIYYTELTRQAELSASLLTRILQRAPAEISSDYDKATLFIAIAQLPAAAEAHRVEIGRAVKSISSDYDQRRTLSAVMNVQPLPASVAAAVIDAAGTVSSNYDRSLVLTQVAEKGGLSAATSPAFMGLVRGMSSSYDQRRVLTAVSSQGALPDGVAADAITATGSMSSSYDRAETLIHLIERGGLNDASADAFFQSASQISSSHDLSRIMRKVVEQPAMSERQLEGVLRTAARIGSGHERANVLEAVANRARVTGNARQLYIAAAKGLSNHDENRALAALVRSER